MFMGSALLPLHPLQLFICSLVGIRTSTDENKGYILVPFDGMSSKWKLSQKWEMCFSHAPQQQSKQSNFSFHTLWITSINAAFVCPGLFTERALNPWIIIIFFFSLSPSTESPSHICSAAISAAQTRIHCSFNNYFYLTPGQRTSIPMIPSKCWTLPRRQTENMTNNPRSGWRPFGCLLRDSMRDIMNIFIWSHSWQEKLSVLSAACCCFLWRMTVCFKAHTQRTKAHDVC